MILVHPTLTVFTVPEWLAQMFDGYTKGNGRIERTNDANGLPIIGKSIVTDPNWDLYITVNGKPLIEWLTEIPYTYNNDI